MNQNFKTILLTVLTLSCFVIALVELSGVSKTAFLNKFNATESEKAAIKATNYLPKTIVEFDHTDYDFGTIREGDKVSHAYKFKNIGDKPLMINDARASCGCTVASYPKQFIQPGQSEEIVVDFDSHGKEGQQDKRVMIYSNAQESAMSISFKANVLKK